MGKAIRILAAIFGLVFAGATALNAGLVIRSRSILLGSGFSGELAAKAARYHLLVILPDSDDAFFTHLLEGVTAGAGEADAAVQVERYDSSSQDGADRWFDIGVRAEVDGLIMYAQQSARVAALADIARKAGVVFVAVGKDAPKSPLPCFIGSASLLQGYQGGAVLAAKLKGEARLGLILPAGGIDGPEEDYLYRGVAASVSMFKGARIVATAWSQPSPLSGEEAASSLIQGHADINAIFCANSGDSLGAAQVVVDRNLVGKVLIVGADETPELLRYLQKGIIMATVVRDSRRIGEEAIRAFSTMKAGGPAPGVIEVDSVVRLSGSPQ